MESVKVNREALVSKEIASSGRISKLVMAISFALLAALGGCSKPDSMDKCLGEDQANVHKGRLKTMRKTCRERVDDYVKSKDGDKRLTLRKDAEHDCTAYSKELFVTKGVLAAKEDSARRREEWSQRDSCKIAGDVTQNRIEALMKGDMKKLTEE